ncbi:hypothetical protein [Nonlabens xiamenensis]|uniref:hypothetical protein n=1 Tax=Nonlabens xiamenensis TaxID=2341043 RepID=UPI000F61284C|nr:hypothetical protein [Nonlabens xiamenensis]
MKSSLQRTSFFILLLALLCSLQSRAQQISDFTKAQRDSIAAMDFINRDYQFISDDFKLLREEIDCDASQQLKNKLSHRIAYKDSLFELLRYNLGGEYQAYLAFHRILKKWENIGFYLWMDSESTKTLACKFDIEHPHLFYEFLASEESSADKRKIFNRLKNKLKEADVESLEPSASYRDWMYHAFEHNPARVYVQKNYLKKNSRHKH